MINYLKIIDFKIFEYVNKNFKNSKVDRIMTMITLCGNWGGIWIVISLCLLGTEGCRIEGGLVIGALVLNTILGEGIIKNLIKRPRPFNNDESSKLLVSKPITYSFPSGHTSSAFAAVSMLIITNSVLSVYLMILAMLIAFSRLYLKLHYFSDIFSGIMLGVVSSIIVYDIFKYTI